MLRIGENEINAVTRVLRSGKLFRYHRGGDCQQFESEYANFLGGKHIQLTASGTAALTSALASLGIGPGDEVIVPAHTYMATATAVIACGAIPVIADVDSSITISPAAIDALVGPHTRAVIPVHMWGLVCDMRAIKKVAAKHKLLVIEDACQCIGGSYRGRMVGTLADAGCYSFNYFKNITCGEAGAVHSRTRSAHEKVVIHTDTCGYFWEGPSTVPHFCAGSARVSEIEGAILREQLKRLPGLLHTLRAHRRRILDITADSPLQPAPVHDVDGHCATHLMYTLPSAELAAAFAQQTGAGIAANTGRHTYNHWVPILEKRGHIHPAMDPFRMTANQHCRMDYHPDMCPTSLDILRRTVMVGNSVDWTAADARKRAKVLRDAARTLL